MIKRYSNFIKDGKFFFILPCSKTSQHWYQTLQDSKEKLVKQGFDMFGFALFPSQNEPNVFFPKTKTQRVVISWQHR